MKKFIYSLLLIIVSCCILFYFFIDILIKETAQKYISSVIKTDVEISFIQTDFRNGTFKMENFTIYNPPGFSKQKAFTLSEINLSIDIKSLFSNTVKINQIIINHAILNVEISPSGTNIAALNENIKNSFKKEEKSSPQEKTFDKEKDISKKVIIKNLLIQNSLIQLNATLTKNKKMLEIPLPEIHLENIGEEKNPITMDKALLLILSIFSQQAADFLVQNISNLLPNLQSAINNIQNVVTEQTTTIQEGINSIKGNIKSFIKHLK